MLFLQKEGHKRRFLLHSISKGKKPDFKIDDEPTNISEGFDSAEVLPILESRTMN